jgi:K+-transporting ATPase ATPase A chain
MNATALSYSLFFLAMLLAASWPLGLYMARVYQERPCGLDTVLGPVERLLYRLTGANAAKEMNWKTYAVAVALFNGRGHRGGLCHTAPPGLRCRSTRRAFPASTPSWP